MRVHGRAIGGRKLLHHVQHGLIEIDADHLAIRAKLLGGEPRYDPGAAGKIKDPLPRRQADSIQQHMVQGLERAWNLVLLIGFGPGA